MGSQSPRGSRRGGWRINLRRWVLYLYHQVASLPKRHNLRALPAFDNEHQQLMRDILLWVSGEVIILAYNPARPCQSV